MEKKCCIPIRTSTNFGSFVEALRAPIGIEGDVANVEEIRLDQVGVGELRLESVDLRHVATLTTREDDGHDEGAYHEEEHDHSKSVHPR